MNVEISTNKTRIEFPATVSSTRGDYCQRQVTAAGAIVKASTLTVPSPKSRPYSSHTQIASQLAVELK